MTKFLGSWPSWEAYNRGDPPDNAPLTPFGEALALLYSIENLVADMPWHSSTPRIMQMCVETRYILERAAAQDNKARQVSTDALDKAPSSGSLPNTSGPASAAPTPLTDAAVFPSAAMSASDRWALLVSVARDLERKLAEAREQHYIECEMICSKRAMEYSKESIGAYHVAASSCASFIAQARRKGS